MASKLLLRPLPFPVQLALRYLRSTRRDAFVSFLSVVAALGIAVGVAALVLVLAALSGLHEQLLGQILSTTPQMEAQLGPDSDPEAVVAAVRGVDGVRSAQRVIRGQGWLVVDDAPQPLRMVGFEGELPPSFPQASARDAGLYVSDGLARRWALEPGRRLQMVSPRPTLGPLGPQPRIRTLELAGTFESHVTDELERAALPLAVAESLLGRRGRRIEIDAGGLDQALALAPAIQKTLPEGATLRTWKDLNRSLYFVLRLEKTLLFVAVGLIVLVAALALVADLALVITSKRAEIGMLGAMGATPATLRRAFVVLGSLLAGAGLTLGAAAGIGGAWALDHYRLLRVPGQSMFVDYIPFHVAAGDLVLVLAITVALVLAASFYAAGRAAALRPVEALKR